MVHHALCNVIEPIFERRFIFDSYACRVGKGTHAALDRAQEFARPLSVCAQVRSGAFLSQRSIMPILRQQLAHVIADTKALWLIDQILDSGAGIHRAEIEPRYFPGDDLFAALRPRGLPIGNLTSQFWANVYLNPLDQFVKRDLKCVAYVRYVDDFLLFADDKPTLHRWRQAVIEFAATLRLTLHEREAVVFPVDDRPAVSGLAGVSGSSPSQAAQRRRLSTAASRDRCGSWPRARSCRSVASLQCKAGSLTWHMGTRGACVDRCCQTSFFRAPT